MKSHEESCREQSHPEFKTSTFCKLWRRYMAVSRSSIRHESLFKCLNFPYLPSTARGTFTKNFSHRPEKCPTGEKCSLTVSQRQAWSLFKKFRRLLVVPVVYCDSRDIPDSQSDSVTGADVIERNFKATKRHAVSNPSRLVSEIDIINYINNQTGMERLRAIFEKDIHGEASVEFQRISSQLSTMVFMIFFGAMLLSGAKGRDEFIQRNKTTVFLTKGLAARRMMDAIFLESIKGGLYWSFRLGFFTAVLITVSEGVAIYRNKTSPLEYTLAGGVAGSITKFSLGPKGMVSGGFFGTLIGFVLGLGITQLLRFGGDTQEDRHFRKIEALLSEEAAIYRSLKPASSAEEDERDYEIE